MNRPFRPIPRTMDDLVLDLARVQLSVAELQRQVSESMLLAVSLRREPALSDDHQIFSDRQESWAASIEPVPQVETETPTPITPPSTHVDTEAVRGGEGAAGLAGGALGVTIGPQQAAQVLPDTVGEGRDGATGAGTPAVEPAPPVPVRNPAFKDVVLDHYAAGRSRAEIKALTGAHPDTIAKVLRKATAAGDTRAARVEVASNSPQRTAEVLDRVLDLWMAGKGHEEIAAQVGRTTVAVNHLIRKARKRGDPRAMKRVDWHRPTEFEPALPPLEAPKEPPQRALDGTYPVLAVIRDDFTVHGPAGVLTEVPRPWLKVFDMMKNGGLFDATTLRGVGNFQTTAGFVEQVPVWQTRLRKIGVEFVNVAKGAMFRLRHADEAA